MWVALSLVCCKAGWLIALTPTYSSTCLNFHRRHWDDIHRGRTRNSVGTELTWSSWSSTLTVGMKESLEWAAQVTQQQLSMPRQLGSNSTLHPNELRSSSCVSVSIYSLVFTHTHSQFTSSTLFFLYILMPFTNDTCGLIHKNNCSSIRKSPGSTWSLLNNEYLLSVLYLRVKLSPKGIALPCLCSLHSFIFP